ncbi:MAG: caspase family protein [Muribaculaceae bacterium]
MRRIVLAICIIVSAFSLSAQDTFEQAYQYYNNKEYDKAVPIYQRLAQGGNAYAQYNLGNCYYNGQGVAKDYTQAVYWYRKSAEQGDADAQYNLGYCYKKGQGVAKDYTQAVYWYRKSAEQGYADAQYNLGNCYYDGQGVAKDYTQAVYWYRKSAEQGDAWAQYNLGLCYKKGQGVAQDYTQAVYWYRKSAEQGYAGAQYNLGNCYYNGQGVAQDYAQAVYWYRKSAEQGVAYAQYNLGYCYKYGQGVSKDMVEAGRWYKLAADQGDEDAKKQYMELYAQGYLSDKKDLASNSANTPTPKQEQTVAQKNETPAADRSIDTDIPVTGIRQDNTFAVIIGNENYQSVAKVPYAANDAKIFAEYCKRTLGLPEENVTVYTDATYGKMLGALQRISNIADAYDGNISIIFYYAGHGIPDDASREAFILPIDADGTIKESCLSLSRLYSSLARLNARRVTAFLDACFSGAERGDGMLASARGVAIKPKQNTIDGNVVVFTAVTGDQTAFPYKPSEHGLFTYYLLKKLKESRGNVSLGELSDYITTNVKQRSIVVNNKLQTPVVIPSDRLSTTWRTLPLR